MAQTIRKEQENRGQKMSDQLRGHRGSGMQTPENRAGDRDVMNQTGLNDTSQNYGEESDIGSWDEGSNRSASGQNQNQSGKMRENRFESKGSDEGNDQGRNFGKENDSNPRSSSQNTSQQSGSSGSQTDFQKQGQNPQQSQKRKDR